jgi:hypothetical protein
MKRFIDSSASRTLEVLIELEVARDGSGIEWKSSIGMPVEVIFEKASEEINLPKFRPVP